MGRYLDTVAVVTGARRGVGRIIAEHFLKEGALVVGLARGVSTIEDPRYRHFQADVGKIKDVQEAFAGIAKHFPTIHIVVNNAAVLTSQYSLILPAERAQAMVETNLLGTFYVSREAAKIMRKSNYGRIINIGSMAARLEPVGDSIYAACKAGVITLANVMAREFSAFNVTCNTLGITAIETDMLQQLPREKIDAIIKNLPISRYATGEDICHVVDFFASPKSSYITAQTVFLGGIH